MSTSPNVQAILQAVLTATNTTLTNNPQISNCDFGNPTYNGTAMYFDPYVTQLTAGTFQQVQLPAATVWGVMVQNLHATATLTISYTSGGVTAEFSVGPTGLFIYWDVSKSGSGITFLSLAGPSSPPTRVPAMVLVVA